MAKLKPCPFCGGKAELYHDTKHGSLSVYSHVVCTNRKCGVSGAWIIESTRYASDDRAIEAWNRRAEDGM